jgi:hypothetical protein
MVPSIVPDYSLGKETCKIAFDLVLSGADVHCEVNMTRSSWCWATLR